MKVLLVGILLLGAVVVVWDRFGGGDSEQGKFDTRPVAIGSVKATVTSTGTLNAVVTVEVGSQLSGQIADVFVDYNDHVKRHQPIAELDARSLAATVKELEAELEVAETNVAVERGNLSKAQATFEHETGRGAVFAALSASRKANVEEAERKLRAKQILRERKVVSQGEMQTSRSERDSVAALLRAAVAEQKSQNFTIQAAEAEVRVAEARIANAEALVKQRKAALSRARVNLERATIRAPIDGIIVGRNVVPGQTVAASLEAPTLFTIAGDLANMEVYAAIDEADIGRIKLNQPATFTVDAYPGRTFEGRVTQIRKSPDTLDNVVTYTVVISTKNPKLLLLPGMTALLRITIHAQKNVLLVPNAALRFTPSDKSALEPAGDTAPAATSPDGGESEATVWTLGPKGKPTPVRVRVGITDGFNTALIAGPLREGQAVIVDEPVHHKEKSGFNFRLKF